VLLELVRRRVVTGDKRQLPILVQRQAALGDHLDVEEAADAEARVIARDAADKGDRNASGDTYAHVVDHLAGRELEAPDALHTRAARRGGDRLVGVRPQ